MTDPTPAGFPRLNPLPDVAERLGVSVRVLREQARDRQFEHVRIGRERYLTDQQLDALIAAKTVVTDRADALAATRKRATAQRRRRKATAQRPAA